MKPNSSPTLIQSIFALRRHLNRRMASLLRKRSNYTVRQLGLVKLVAEGEILTQAQAAERLGIDPPAVSRLVDVLEKAGLLVRCAGESRRSGRLEVTALGRREMAPINEVLEEAEQELVHALGSDDAHQLSQILERLTCTLRQRAEEQAHE